MRTTRVALIALVTIGAAAMAVVPLAREAPPRFAAPHEHDRWPLTEGREEEERLAALRRAKVWMRTDPAAANLRSNPEDPSGLLSEPIVRCRFLSAAPHGTTPKFTCVLRDGEVVKVKYGTLTNEIHAEVAASRLLAALGFGADRMYLLPRVRCYGCPRFPFHVSVALERFDVREALARWLPGDRFVDFEWVAVERRFEGREIAAGDSEGWPWYELDRIEPVAGGASRAEVDALRVAATFLAHWDNKAANQRLVCRGAGADAPAPCARPFALIHDLGATFGPNKVDLDAWRSTPVWADASRCRISMRELPYEGGTFRDIEITEAGRHLIARQLAALGARQIGDLFDAARFGNVHRLVRLKADPTDGSVATVAEWVDAFQAKVGEITSAGPCPATPGSQR